MPLSLAMPLGVIEGGLLLRFMASRGPDQVLGATLIAVGIWLLFFRPRRKGAAAENRGLPETYRVKDLGVCLIAGAG